jgi:hypothetical protein
MRHVTAEVAKKTSPMKGDECTAAGESLALDRRYGEIGILAVAAAARYQGSAKNPAYAPASNKWRDRIAEEAA